MRDLESMKYAELRQLAKSVGIKANMKQEKLIALLKKYYSANENTTDEQKQNEKSQQNVQKATPSTTPEVVNKTKTDPPKSNSSKLSAKTLARVSKSQTPKSKPTTPVQKPVPAQPSAPQTDMTVTQTNNEQEQKKKTVANIKSKKATPSTTPVVVNKTKTDPPQSKEANSSKVAAKTLARVSKAQTPKSKPSTPVQKPVPSQPTAPKTDVTITQTESITPIAATSSSSTELTTENSSAPISTSAESSTPLTQQRSGSRWQKKVFTPTQTSSSPANALAGKRKRSETPSDEQSAKKNRRSTFEKAPTPGIKTPEVFSPAPDADEASPGVDDMLRVMKSDMSSQEMKEALMTAIDKKVHNKLKNAPAPTATSTNIPRFAAFALKIKEEKKPITPCNKDWKRIHEKQFEKFDSIDVYLDKKRKRAEELTTSVKKARTILDEVHNVANRLKAHKTPVLDENKPVKQRRSNPNKTTPFKPTVINTSQMNLNFGAMKSPKASTGKSPKSVISTKVKSCTSGLSARKSAGSIQQKSMSTTTPFKFTATAGSTATLNSTTMSTKKAFDLKASLAKPLTWKPHKGKLRPVDGGSTKSPVYVKTAVKDLKTAAKVQTERVNARSTVNERRANKKEQAQMARRGIKV